MGEIEILAAEMDVMAEEIALLRVTLLEAGIQIRRLHEEFRETGSGNAILAKINDVLNRP